MYHFSLLESLDAVICILLCTFSQFENDWQITFKLAKISKRNAKYTRICAS